MFNIDFDSKKGKNILIILLLVIIILLGILLFIGFINKDKGSKKINNNQNIDNIDDTKPVEVSTSNNLSVKTKNTTNVVNKTIGGIKTHTVYSGKDKLNDGEEAFIDLILTGDYEFYMDDASSGAAEYYRVGTYEIKNNELYLTSKYKNGTDCTTVKDTETFKFKIKDGTIIATDMYNMELKENKNSDFKFSKLLNEICVVENNITKSPVSYEYSDSRFEIELDFLLFDNYILTYCNSKTCFTSVGTYSYNDSSIVLNQNKYQGSDNCYYKQTKQYNLSYTKLNNEQINKIKEENKEQIVYFDKVKINLKDNEGFIDEEFVLTDDINIETKNINKLFNSKDFLGVYCEQ